MEDWRTITIFIETGKDVNVHYHGNFANWEIESILMRALEKNHEDQFGSTTELKEIIDGSEDGED